MDKIEAVFAKLSVSLEWIAARIAARPKAALTAALAAWIVSLVFVAWAF